MRTIPGMVVLCPADAEETKQMVFKAAEYEGPVYIRLGRLATPDIFDENYKFEIGKGVEVVSGTDATIIATGMLVNEAIEASKELSKEGISVRVINMGTIKPLDKEIVLKASKETKVIFTAEEHSIIGGLGGAVAEYLSEVNPSKVVRIGVEDRFGQSGKGAELLEKYGLTKEGIIKKVKENL
jgi:transketolase